MRRGGGAVGRWGGVVGWWGGRVGAVGWWVGRVMERRCGDGLVLALLERCACSCVLYVHECCTYTCAPSYEGGFVGNDIQGSSIYRWADGRVYDGQVGSA